MKNTKFLINNALKVSREATQEEKRHHIEYKETKKELQKLQQSEKCLNKVAELGHGLSYEEDIQRLNLKITQDRQTAERHLESEMKQFQTHRNVKTDAKLEASLLAKRYHDEELLQGIADVIEESINTPVRPDLDIDKSILRETLSDVKADMLDMKDKLSKERISVENYKDEHQNNKTKQKLAQNREQQKSKREEMCNIFREELKRKLKKLGYKKRCRTKVVDTVGTGEFQYCYLNKDKWCTVDDIDDCDLLCIHLSKIKDICSKGTGKEIEDKLQADEWHSIIVDIPEILKEEILPLVKQLRELEDEECELEKSIKDLPDTWLMKFSIKLRKHLRNLFYYVEPIKGKTDEVVGPSVKLGKFYRNLMAHNLVEDIEVFGTDLRYGAFCVFVFSRTLKSELSLLSDAELKLLYTIHRLLFTMLPEGKVVLYTCDNSDNQQKLANVSIELKGPDEMKEQILNSEIVLDPLMIELIEWVENKGITIPKYKHSIKNIEFHLAQYRRENNTSQLKYPLKIILILSLLKIDDHKNELQEWIYYNRDDIDYDVQPVNLTKCVLAKLINSLKS
ncbi:MAG: hypothetical protein BEN19_00650 [Epulopiscium sp. Nuni2H_MBin003]|nr:MAG: hypothetical protein BEN19_00650 [Epulopiscium sp. Nuni2H_MBin003]